MSTQGAVQLNPQFQTASKGTSAQRPAHPAAGEIYFDTTLAAGGKPIWCRDASTTPPEWCDANGGLSAAPTVTSLVPNTGLAAGGNAVAVHGTSFLEATDVLVDGVSAGVKGVDWTIVDDGHIDIAAIAAHAAGAVFIRVVNPLGTSPTGVDSTYTYT